MCMGAWANSVPEVYVDSKGVMRWNDTHREASFYGVNYTLPFAHAYRAVGYLGGDYRAAIDQDVYHFARLGFNAFRIHIWDVEISDDKGNLLENDHLNLLDYLMAKLQERGIYTVITFQTNFGNGYPERNQPTGAYSYLYDKCRVHEDPLAIAAQERYVKTLVNHVNPFNGKSYGNDPMVVGFEINNEPCHKGTVKSTNAYIRRMVAALHKAGNRKPVFYNVTHNLDLVEAYYDQGIQGTTYQWYPIGLVSGHIRKGNFLPYVDQYPIPFREVKGFHQKAKLVYEFDPADVLCSYLYPAVVRSFRTAGFQWMTQFAYDPMCMAAYNTEYQTHYLNVAYTPAKAVSMKIAAEAARTLPLNQSYGVFPVDTVFGAFRVSVAEDLSELNTPGQFFHSNHTATLPVNPEALTSVAGVGQSPVVQYEGTGAYWLDRLEPGVWRLEVMPDAVVAADPFAKPSLQREVVRIYRNSWNMGIQLPDLGNRFSIKGLNDGNRFEQTTQNGVIQQVSPGSYLLIKAGATPQNSWTAETQWQHIRLGEFEAPTGSAEPFTIRHEPLPVVEAGKPITLLAEVAGAVRPDSVCVFTSRISFWNDHNPCYVMKRTRGMHYAVELPAWEVGEGTLKYNVVVYCNGKKTTYPAGVSGEPLDWDYTGQGYYTVHTVAAGSAVELFEVTDSYSSLETYTLPEWSADRRAVVHNGPLARNTLHLWFQSPLEHPWFVARKYVGDQVAGRKNRLATAEYLCIHLKEAPHDLQISLVTQKGYTYSAYVPKTDDEVVKIPLKNLKTSETQLLPQAYPVFMPSVFRPVHPVAFAAEEIEWLELKCTGSAGKAVALEFGNIWIE